MQKSPLLKNISTNPVFAILAMMSALPAFSNDENQIGRYKVVSAAPYEQLSETFIRPSGWTGADGAYSTPLNSNLSLWLFGDTWIGNVSKGSRVKPTMINNSAAWQFIDTASGLPAPFQFFWKTSNRKAESIIQSNLKDTWIWPGDSAFVDGRLFLFLHLIHRTPHDKSACIGDVCRSSTRTVRFFCNLFSARLEPRHSGSTFRAVRRTLERSRADLHLSTNG